MLRVKILINCRWFGGAWALGVQRICGCCSKGHVRGTGEGVALVLDSACMRPLKKADLIDLRELIFSLVLTVGSLTHLKH